MDQIEYWNFPLKLHRSCLCHMNHSQVSYLPNSYRAAYWTLNTQCTKILLQSMSVTQYLIPVAQFCLSYCTVSGKKHYDQDNTNKRKHLIGGLVRVFREFIYYCLREHAGMQAGMALEPESFTFWSTGRDIYTESTVGFLKPQRPPPVTCFLQDHIS